MPIKITKFDTKPAINYDEVHVNELRILLSEDKSSKANVRIVYKFFGRDEEGNKYFSRDQQTMQIDDAFADAVSMAQAGDFALAQALGALEAAVADILQKTGKYGATQVV
jgi:hypothetical protein